ncbi:MAG: RluA family pseudouridine synthase [Myxococcota bacterium]|nr:RluA family pseudouridine synthase [Myxococcota bacterium]
MKDTNFKVDAKTRLAAALRTTMGLSNKKAKQIVYTGKVRVNGKPALDPAQMVDIGQTIDVNWTRPKPKQGRVASDHLIYRDAELIVLNKPAGLLSTSTNQAERDTALTVARTLCRGGKPPHVVHRLDKDTSGLIIFARGTKAARQMRLLIDANEVERTYFCVVDGIPTPSEGTISSTLIRDNGKGRRGSRDGSFQVQRPTKTLSIVTPKYGKHAITHYQSVAQTDGRTAMEVRLQTGRTHQIRIHMAELGCPLIGERVYAKQSDAHRHALHAGRLSLPHPFKTDKLAFKAPWPADLEKVSPIGANW